MAPQKSPRMQPVSSSPSRRPAIQPRLANPSQTFAPTSSTLTSTRRRLAWRASFALAGRGSGEGTRAAQTFPPGGSSPPPSADGGGGGSTGPGDWQGGGGVGP